MTKEELAKLLKEAETAHAKHVKATGGKDSNWPEWYAEFIIKKLESKDG